MMSVADQRTRYVTVTAGARVFALIALAGPVALAADAGPVLSLALLSATWMAAIVVEGLARVPVMTALVIEASIVTFLAATSLGETSVLLPALVIPPFIGGLVRGTRGAFEVLGAQLAVLAATIIPSAQISLTPNLAGTLFTWLMAGLGFGALAALIHLARTTRPDTTTSYRDARKLITQLLDLSGELVDGLDPVSIGQNIIDLASEEAPLTGLVIYTANGSDFTAILTDGDAIHPKREVLLRAVSLSGRAAKAGQRVAFPLFTDASLVGIVAGDLVPGSRTDSTALEAALTDLADRLRPEALQLDTALLFSAVRAEATAEERRRLAREMHDGVAQDLAALGYLIDGLTDTTPGQEQDEHVRELRGELTKVVAELRRSIFNLRNEAAHGRSLGESIRGLAQHIETRSGLPFNVVVDESGRLRPDVEAELLRVAQEAMNNAVKHARASRIDVTVQVQAPSAEITVSDNGRGLQAARDDSHGLRIMRERSRRIGAALEIRPPERGTGTIVSVALQPRAIPSEHNSNTEGLVG